jgi:hypothetical protein
MATSRIIRDSSLRLKLQPELKVRLERLSGLMGVPPSTLAAVWLGQAVATQERSLSIVSEMAKSIGGEVGDYIKSEMVKSMALFTDVGERISEAEPKVLA